MKLNLYIWMQIHTMCCLCVIIICYLDNGHTDSNPPAFNLNFSWVFSELPLFVDHISFGLISNSVQMKKIVNSGWSRQMQRLTVRRGYRWPKLSKQFCCLVLLVILHHKKQKTNKTILMIWKTRVALDRGRVLKNLTLNTCPPDI